MTDGYNPYQAPAADLASAPGGTGELYTPAMLQHLKDTKPWVRFLSVMGFIMTGLTVIGVIAMLAASASGMGASEAGAMAGIAAVYGMSAAVTLLLSMHLHRYAEAIVEASSGGGVRAVEGALLRQKSFWRTAGIIGVVTLVLAALGVVLGIVVGVMAAQGVLD